MAITTAEAAFEALDNPELTEEGFKKIIEELSIVAEGKNLEATTVLYKEQIQTTM